MDGVGKIAYPGFVGSEQYRAMAKDGEVFVNWSEGGWIHFGGLPFRESLYRTTRGRDMERTWDGLDELEEYHLRERNQLPDHILEPMICEDDDEQFRLMCKLSSEEYRELQETAEGIFRRLRNVRRLKQRLADLIIYYCSEVECSSDEEKAVQACGSVIPRLSGEMFVRDQSCEKQESNPAIVQEQDLNSSPSVFTDCSGKIETPEAELLSLRGDKRTLKKNYRRLRSNDNTKQTVVKNWVQKR